MRLTRYEQEDPPGVLPGGSDRRGISAESSGEAVSAERHNLRPALVTGLHHDRRDFRVGHEACPALFIPIEERPHAVFLARIAEDGTALGAVLLALVGALGREDLQELVEIIDRCRRENHHSSPALSGATTAQLTNRRMSGTIAPRMGWIPQTAKFSTERARARARRAQRPPGSRPRSWNKGSGCGGRQFSERSRARGRIPSRSGPQRSAAIPRFRAA